LKIIDFHTHTFDEYVAKRAIDKLSKSANIINYADGTDSCLEKLNIDESIDLSVVLPVATKIMQADGINAKNVKKNAAENNNGLLYFAAIHPEDSNIRRKLSTIKGAGFKGIKLHPVFQDAYIDEKCYLELIDTASDLDLITVIHAGYDISFPGVEYADVKYLLNMIQEVKPRNLVLAHMGGWGQWDMVESDLAGADVYLDTSFCLEKHIPLDNNGTVCDVNLSAEQFLRIVKLHGSDKILFGSDSPWTSRTESVQNIKATGLDQEDLKNIFFDNARRLLKINETIV